MKKNLLERNIMVQLNAGTTKAAFEKEMVQNVTVDTTVEGYAVKTLLKLIPQTPELVEKNIVTAKQILNVFRHPLCGINDKVKPGAIARLNRYVYDKVKTEEFPKFHFCDFSEFSDFVHKNKIEKFKEIVVVDASANHLAIIADDIYRIRLEIYHDPDFDPWDPDGPYYDVVAFWDENNGRRFPTCCGWTDINLPLEEDHPEFLSAEADIDWDEAVARWRNTMVCSAVRMIKQLAMSGTFNPWGWNDDDIKKVTVKMSAKKVYEAFVKPLKNW